VALSGTNDPDDLQDILNGGGDIVELKELYVKRKEPHGVMRKEGRFKGAPYHDMFPKSLNVDFKCPTMRAFRETRVAAAMK
jgi:hypothetical protein